MNEKNNLEIVASFNNTIPGRMIQFRAAMKFWNRYPGDTYSHISLSHDVKLGNMMSFARKEINNPFNAGLIKEDIRTGMFKQNKKYSKIAVMKLEVTSEQYDRVLERMKWYWEHREEFGFNFEGLTSMLFVGKGVAPKNKFFCSQWVASVLKESGIDLFDGKDPKDIKPFDFYGVLKDHIIYEGPTIEYPEYYSFRDDKKIESLDVNSDFCENVYVYKR